MRLQSLHYNKTSKNVSLCGNEQNGNLQKLKLFSLLYLVCLELWLPCINIFTRIHHQLQDKLLILHKIIL